MERFKYSLVLASVSCGLIISNVASAQLSAVTVGDLGNPNDSTGYGSVGYTYDIMTDEVTLSQYCTFLNAVATNSDSYNLYNVNMGSQPNIAGISRSGSSGSYQYTVVGNGNRPVTYVSWFDAARFANWMDNGTPYGNETTGTTETGAYSLNGATSGIIPSSLTGSGWRLPTENEWYKAAYYQPASAGGPPGGYWTYATRSSTQPRSTSPGSAFDLGNSANFYYNDGLANGYNGGYAVNNSTAPPTGSALTDVGSYTLSYSYYHTYDQSGNAAEWTDGVVGSQRVTRGGSWNDANISSNNRLFNLPTSENFTLGFRLVDIPEPGSLGFLAIGFGLLVWNRRNGR